MSLLRTLGRAYLANRILRGSRHHRRRPPRYHRGWGAPTRYHRRRPRGRTGFFGPLPYHTRQTRGGGRVTVGGCCLPIPLGMLLGSLLLARLAMRRG